MRPTKPSPGLTPQEVVRIQLQALKKNDVPETDNGIRIAFRFASPRSLAFTGPLEHFVSIVKNPTFAALVNHDSATFYPLRLEGDNAIQRVTIRDSSGQRAVFLFYLSRQKSGPDAGCWLTDGIVREPPAVLAVA